MNTAIVTLKSLSPYSQSRHYDEVEVPKLPEEQHNDYEKRTWRYRMHRDEKGMVIIPPMCFKLSLEGAASFLAMKIPGRRNQTYKKFFEAAVLVMEPVVLPLRVDDVQAEWLFVPSDGKKGGGSRVNKCFPIIHEWEGTVTYHLLDSTITEEVFRKHLEKAGELVGIGRFRPQRGGFYGRYEIVDLIWG